MQSGYRVKTVTIDKDASSGTVDVSTNGLNIVGMIVIVPPLHGSTTSTTKVKLIDATFTGVYLWSPTALAAKTTGTYITYPCEETTAPKPLNGVPTFRNEHNISDVRIEITTSGAQATDAVTFNVMVLLGE